VSNPVAPPPPNQGGFPPPANQGFGAAPAGQPFPGQQPAPPGQPFPGQPQQGFGDAPPPFTPPPTAKKKRGAGSLFLRIGIAIVVIIVGFGVRSLFFGDKAKDAAVNDCVAASKDVKASGDTDAQAKVVDCTSKDAAYVVVGRVNGESDVKSKSCDKFFTKENGQYYVYASSSDDGGKYLLCLEAK
jgi:hypothetical protein